MESYAYQTVLRGSQSTVQTKDAKSLKAFKNTNWSKQLTNEVSEISSNNNLIKTQSSQLEESISTAKKRKRRVEMSTMIKSSISGRNLKIQTTKKRREPVYSIKLPEPSKSTNWSKSADNSWIRNHQWQLQQDSVQRYKIKSCPKIRSQSILEKKWPSPMKKKRAE